MTRISSSSRPSSARAAGAALFRVGEVVEARSKSGDRAGALCAIEEAVAIRRRLAQAQPAAFGPYLSMSLQLREALIVG
jgi:hypothetical protein